MSDLNRLTIREDRDQRIAVLRSCVAERLFLPLDRVTLESRLIEDLGADSLDFVDLLFQMEHRFGVQFQQHEFLDFAFRRLTPQGALLPEAVEQLREWLPELTHFDSSQVTAKDVLALITVGTLLVMVERKLLEESSSQANKS